VSRDGPGLRKTAFLNIPYDDRYKNLYFALIAGLCALGVKPRATLEISDGERRLDRIFKLMTSCHYSFHDLSRVQIDRKSPRTPRFNMPFELGLLWGWKKTAKDEDHKWWVLEAVDRRLPKSLSDLNGTDPLIHGETVRGIFGVLNNAFVNSKYRPTVPQMYRIYRDIKNASHLIMKDAGAKDLYEARVFEELVVLAGDLAKLTIPPS
jgi:hypothetical protein